MTDSSKCDLNGTRTQFHTCPKCKSSFDTSYSLPKYGKHFIQMHCHDCEIGWKLDDRSVLLDRGHCGEQTFVTYVISGLKAWFVD